MKRVNLVPIVLVAAMMSFSGCGKTVLENQSTTDENMRSPVQSEPVVAEASPAPEPQVQLPEPDSRHSFLSNVIYFDFDSAMLTQEAQSTLQLKAQWLKENPQVKTLLIEGHCDERGTDAYNMALGGVRAETVKNYLIDLGVDIRRLETQSYGEEKPAVDGHNEEAWAQNRRASFVMKPQP